MAVTAAVLAAFLALQAIGSVQTRKEPAVASLVAPWNGLAFEQLATREFRASASDGTDIPAAALAAVPSARKAFGLDPLTPKALAIMALAEQDASQKAEILDGATVLNRRDLLLQGILLEQQIKAADYSETLATLDRILRVHPRESVTFFPILIQALRQDGAVPAFADILGARPVWLQSFLQAAVNDGEALSNLAKLRLTMEDVEPSIDQRLVAGLVGRGDREDAYEMYLHSSKSSPVSSYPYTLNWNSALPPFDWAFVDDANFRAQTAVTGDTLEVFIKSGNGGVLAARMIPNPSRPLVFTFSHSITPANQARDLKLAVQCADSDTMLIEQSFSGAKSTVELPPTSCSFLNVTLLGRAWSGRSAIRGNIGQLTVATR